MKSWIMALVCVFLSSKGMSRHIPGRFEIVNILVNKEKKAVVPEGVFELRLKKGTAYSVAYQTRKAMPDADKVKIEAEMGNVPVPEFLYCPNEESSLGVMPPDIRLMFDKLDAYCVTNDTDYLAVSIDSKLVDNGELSKGLYFVVTNTPPISESVAEMHPVFMQLWASRFEAGASATNGIPVGANPAQWFSEQ